jgi:hypothetical protein
LIGSAMLARSRELRIFTVASYLLAITASALFHEHRSGGERQLLPCVSAAQGEDDHDCSVCQFLAQKPAPAADVAPVGASEWVQELPAASPVSAASGVFSAWHSRAPPAIA